MSARSSTSPGKPSVERNSDFAHGQLVLSAAALRLRGNSYDLKRRFVRGACRRTGERRQRGGQKSENGEKLDESEKKIRPYAAPSGSARLCRSGKLEDFLSGGAHEALSSTSAGKKGAEARSFEP